MSVVLLVLLCCIVATVVSVGTVRAGWAGPSTYAAGVLAGLVLLLVLLALPEARA